jgi:hypothetical protein
MLKSLDDGGEVSLGWRMEVDPDTILSVDTESSHGVRLLRCGPDELQLEMPEKHLQRHIRVGSVIVASSFVHQCGHLGRYHMYHRVKEVRDISRTGIGSPAAASLPLRVTLATNELPSLAHALPSVSFNFSYMPAEALDPSPFPLMRTNFGQTDPDFEAHNPARSRQRHNRDTDSRRLQAFGTGGGAQFGLPPGGFPPSAFSAYHPSAVGNGLETMDKLLTLIPKQMSNFGWNWNFFMNDTEEPEFNYTLPGIDGYMKLKQPYVKVHAGIYLNFSSHFKSIREAPKVAWKAGVDAHGVVSGRMLTDIKSTSKITEDPFHLFQLPLLEELGDIMWFEKIDFSVGAMPLAVQPGFQFKAEMYHTGLIDGTVQLGGKTNFVVKPEIRFDSELGFFSGIKADFKDTDLYPPLWIVATNHFEMGVALEPQFWLGGQFGTIENSKAGFELRPYLNMTIKRDGADLVGKDTKTLIAYPFRIMGLPNRFNKKYKAKISANGVDHETSPELNWGQVSFHDHISKFDCGAMPQDAMLTDAIKVTLIEVDDSSGKDVERKLGTSDVQCTTMLNGQCQPSPSTVQFEIGGANAYIEMAVLWEDNPIPWFASRIRAVALSFPKVSLREVALQKAVPSLSSASGPTDKFTLKITHAGRSYASEIKGPSKLGSQVLFEGTQTLDLGPTFLENWMPCHVQGCESGQLELFYGTHRIAWRNLPEIPWNSITDSYPDSGSTDVDKLFDRDTEKEKKESLVQKTVTTAVMQAVTDVAVSTAQTASLVTQKIPLSVALTADGKPGPPVAIVSMSASVADPSHGSFFLKPEHAAKASVGHPYTFDFTVANVNDDVDYSFRYSALKMVPAASVDKHAAVKSATVGGQILKEVEGSHKAVTARCQRNSIPGINLRKPPCSFAYDLELSRGSYAMNDYIVLMVKWMEGNQEHIIYSPPLEIASHSSGRRLFTEEDWNQRLASRKQTCEQKDLNFRVGFGMMTRAKLEDDMSGIFPMIGQKRPQISTGFQKLAEDDLVNSKADKLLPDNLCNEGVCSGRMPGCTEANFEMMHFPELLFNFNRDFLYEDLGEGTDSLKEVLAYAFSTLPEAVEMTIERLNSTGTTTQSPYAGFQPTVQWPSGYKGYPYPAGATPSMPGVYSGFQPTPTYGGFQPQPTYAGMPAGAYPMMPVPGIPAVQGGTSPSRRLRARNGAASHAARKSPPSEPLQGRSARVRFTKGLPLIVDRPLVEMMLRHGMFAPVNDDLSHVHGPLFIEDFEVHDTGAVRREGKHDDSAKLESANYVVFSAICGMIATLAAAICALSIRCPSQKAEIDASPHDAIPLICTAS